MLAALPIDESAWNDRHRRLAVCMAISTVALFLVIALVRWPPRLELPRFVPLELEITIRPPADRSERDAPELPPPLPAPAEAAEPALPATAEEATAPVQAPESTRAQPAEKAAASELPVGSTVVADAPPAQVDWYAELERVAAEVGARAAEEPQSMHPEFDELRRFAALHYGKPQIGQRKPTWEAEDDPYGRTLLRRGDTYMILEDRRLFNQYAFETFEKHMIFVDIPLGRAPPKNLPWVEAIRARYEYLRDPDELPPLKVLPAVPGPAAQ
jgi:hypothetical protein